MIKTDVEYLVVGRVQRAHALKGVVLVDPMTDFPDRFVEDARLWIGQSENVDALQEVVIRTASIHQTKLLVEFKGIRTRTQAEGLAGMYLFVPVDQCRTLGEDEYYHHELVGLQVRTKSGDYIGEINQVLNYGENELLSVLDANNCEKLIPFASEFIKRIDLDAGVLILEPVEGLLEL